MVNIRTPALHQACERRHCEHVIMQTLAFTSKHYCVLFKYVCVFILYSFKSQRTQQRQNEYNQSIRAQLSYSICKLTVNDTGEADVYM